MKNTFKPSIVFKQLVKHGIDNMPWHTCDIDYNLIPYVFSDSMRYMKICGMSIRSCQVGLTDEKFNDVEIPITNAMLKAWNSCVWLNKSGYAYKDIPRLYKKHKDAIEEEFAAILVAVFETSKKKNCDISLWNGNDVKVVLCKKTDDFGPICDRIKNDFPEIKCWLDKKETASKSSRSIDDAAKILVNYDLGIDCDLPWTSW